MDSLRDCCVDQVLDFSTCETWCHLSQYTGSNRLSLRYFVQIELENVLTAVDVRVGYMDLFIKTAWADRGRIQRSFVVRCTYHHYIAVLLEAIHFSQDLVECGTAGAGFNTGAS